MQRVDPSTHKLTIYEITFTDLNNSHKEIDFPSLKLNSVASLRTIMGDGEGGKVPILLEVFDKDQNRQREHLLASTEFLFTTHTWG